MRVALFLFVASCLPGPTAAQEPTDADPTDILMRLRDRVLAHADRIPNYLCVETVTRDRYEPPDTPVPRTCDGIMARRKTPNFPTLLRLATTDRLRLDVAYAGSREIYSWAGAERFEDGEIDELIPDGAIATGPFAGLLLSAFRGRAPQFVYEGETKIDERAVLEFSYSLAREESRYRVKAGAEWVITGYSGTLWVDSKTAELVRMAVRTDELPPETQSCESQTTLDYGMVQLGKVEYLLPKGTRQRFISRDGSEAENQLTFASCREYQGKATVQFGGGSAFTEAPRQSPAAPAFPVGLPVTIDLTGTIDTRVAAAGDAVRGRLAQAVEQAAAGSAVDGRLMRVEMRHGSRPEVVIALRWETIDMEGAKVPLVLAPKRKTAGRKVTGLKTRGVVIELPAASDALHGVYYFPGNYVVIGSGFRTEWTTTRR